MTRPLRTNSKNDHHCKSEHAREQGRVCQDAIPNKASEGYRTALQTIKLGAEVRVGESLTKSGKRTDATAEQPDERIESHQG